MPAHEQIDPEITPSLDEQIVVAQMHLRIANSKWGEAVGVHNEEMQDFNAPPVRRAQDVADSAGAHLSELVNARQKTERDVSVRGLFSVFTKILKR